MIGREHFFLDDVKDMSDKEILSGFIKQYYLDKETLPAKIMLKEEIEDEQTIADVLTEKSGKKVEFKTPKKGEKLRFVEMAENNAKITLENKLKDKTSILEELRDVLELEDLPRKIECYDISNISGTNIVAGMVVAIDGEIKKNLSRRFKIKTVFGQDDPRCMEEVVTRRLAHSVEGDGVNGAPNSAFGNLPEVIFADGGITQINAVLNAIQKYNFDIKVFGMVKDDKHRTRALLNTEREELEVSQDILKFITNLQDEVHKVAIEYHKKLRDKEVSKSKLDDITGIGPKKKQELLKHFKTIEDIANADAEEIARIAKVNNEIAQNIIKALTME